MGTILITGATRSDGIGLAAAKALKARGDRVIITGRDDRAGKQQELAHGIEYLHLDLSSPREIKDFGEALLDKIAVLDVLVNNAGTLLDGSTLVTETSVATLTQTFSINTFAPLLLTQALLPLLKRSPKPRIVNVSSGAGQLSDGELASWAPAYSASKAALNALTQQLAATLKDFSINSICPGWCHTEMGGASAPRTPEQGADTIVWLATEAPQSLTGHFLRDRKPIQW